MYVTVLGPVGARSGEASIAVSPNQRLLIAMLAEHAGRVVSADRLIDALWGAALPNHPGAALQNLVSRVRGRLSPDDGQLLVTDPPGYRLTLDDSSLDRISFERKVAAGAAEPELEARVDASPYRERGHALLVDALDRSRRPRDALRACARYRDILVNELGLDPSPAMQHLEHEILVGNRPRPAPVESSRGPHPRDTLTSRRTSFVGRDAILDDHPTARTPAARHPRWRWRGGQDQPCDRGHPIAPQRLRGRRLDRRPAMDPRFQLEERDSTLLTTICRRLDGLPLALELAAARVPALGMKQLADRLDDRFSLLTTNHRQAAEHHQTLRAAITWSVDLLNPTERALLARLSVFVGGFDLDAAESVAQGPDLPAHTIADTLAALVDRSLVVSTRTAGVVRHRLLDTIREYAATELSEPTTDLERGHRDWCSTVARDIGEGSLVNTTFWYQRLQTEFPNLRAAFVWSMEHGQVTEALDLAASLRWAPFNTGHLYREHRGWIETALAAARGTTIDRRTMGRGLVAAGAVAGLESRSSEAIVAAQRSARDPHPARRCERDRLVPHWLGAFHTDLGDHQSGVEHSRAGLALARSRASPTELAYLANQHAENAAAATFLYDPQYFDEARVTYELAIAHSSAHGIEEGLVRARHGLAVLHAGDDSRTSLDECVDTLSEWRRLGHGNRLIMSLVSASRIAVRAGQPLASMGMQMEALDAIGTVGWNQPLGRLLETAGVTAAMSGNISDAGFLAGAASCRFLTPRWFVPISVREQFGQARSVDPQGWDLAAARGTASSDEEAIAIVRRQLSPRGAPSVIDLSARTRPKSGSARR